MKFAIIASGLNPQAEDFESRFYEAGCDDVSISFQDGHIIVDFAREATSIDTALSTAVANIAEAGATILRISAT